MLWRKIAGFNSILFNLLKDQLRQYFTQLRQEMGQRLVDRVFGDDDKPSKVGYNVQDMPAICGLNISHNNISHNQSFVQFFGGMALKVPEWSLAYPLLVCVWCSMCPPNLGIV